MWEKAGKLQNGGVKLKTCSESFQLDSIRVDEFVLLPQVKMSLTIVSDAKMQFVVQRCVIKPVLLEILRGDKVYLVLEECGGGKLRQIQNDAGKDDVLSGR